MIYFTVVIYLLGGLSCLTYFCDMADIGSELNNLSHVVKPGLEPLDIFRPKEARYLWLLVILIWPVLVVLGQYRRFRDNRRSSKTPR